MDDHTIMAYELWDVETATILESYSTDEDAARVIRETACQQGELALRHFALAFEDASGETQPIGSGSALIRWAEAILKDDIPSVRSNEK
jgi:hypothetical protein